MDSAIPWLNPVNDQAGGSEDALEYYDHRDNLLRYHPDVNIRAQLDCKALRKLCSWPWAWVKAKSHGAFEHETRRHTCCNQGCNTVEEFTTGIAAGITELFLEGWQVKHGKEKSEEAKATERALWQHADASFGFAQLQKEHWLVVCKKCRTSGKPWDPLEAWQTTTLADDATEAEPPMAAIVHRAAPAAAPQGSESGGAAVRRSPAERVHVIRATGPHRRKGNGPGKQRRD